MFSKVKPGVYILIPAQFLLIYPSPFLKPQPKITRILKRILSRLGLSQKKKKGGEIETEVYVKA